MADPGFWERGGADQYHLVMQVTVATKRGEGVGEGLVPLPQYRKFLKRSLLRGHFSILLGQFFSFIPVHTCMMYMYHININVASRYLYYLSV